ncbi:hypothetical protein AALC17_05250 [Oscillospiraceae bacterium 38-13]
MERMTEHHVNKSLGAYIACSMACINDNFDCNNCKKLAEMIDRLSAYEDTGLKPEAIEALKGHALMGALESPEMEEYSGSALQRADRLIAEYESLGGINHLRELAETEKDGRLVVMPCKVGDTVYEVNKRGFVSTYEVISIHVSSCSILVRWNLVDGIYSNLNGFEVSALGKTIFLTREEAEAALKKREVANGADA